MVEGHGAADGGDGVVVERIFAGTGDDAGEKSQLAVLLKAHLHDNGTLFAVEHGFRQLVGSDGLDGGVEILKEGAKVGVAGVGQYLEGKRKGRRELGRSFLCADAQRGEEGSRAGENDGEQECEWARHREEGIPRRRENDEGGVRPGKRGAETDECGELALSDEACGEWI
jgi:hypothetical protein